MAKKAIQRSMESILPEETTDDLFSFMLQAAQKELGHVYTGTTDNAHVWCLQVPAFSIRFLLQQEGWPLERFTQFVGPKKTYKSTLAKEVIRWHHLQSPPNLSVFNGVVIRTEPKPAPEIDRAILEYNDKILITVPAATIQEWTSALYKVTKLVQSVMDNKPKTGRIFPVCFVTDSLTAVLEEKQKSHIETEGIPELHFPVQANLLSDYMKGYPQQLVNYPFSWIGINHLKYRIDSDGREVRNIPGGKAPEYHESLEIETSKVKDITRVGEYGARIGLKVTENSMAPHEYIQVELVSYIDHDDIDEETGERRQKIFFDWHSASIEILVKYAKETGVTIRRKLNEIVDLHGSEKERTFWSVSLGISEDEPLSYQEAGQVLEEKLQGNKEFRDRFYPLLGVRRRNLFQPGIDYQKQIKVALAKLKDNATNAVEEATTIDNGQPLSE